MTHLIPQSFIDEIIYRQDIVELIDSYIPLKKTGQNYLACCPFHNEKTPSFNVSAKKQFYHCFGCKASGNVISFIMNYLNQSFIEAVETLSLRLGLTVPRENQIIHYSVNLYELLQQVTKFYQKNLKKNGSIAIDYLKKRQVSGKIAKHYLLGYASNHNTLLQAFPNNQKELLATGMIGLNDDFKPYDKYRHRITFPIQDSRGRIIAFGARALSEDQKPKYLNSPETVVFHKSRELYGLYQVLQNNASPENIIIVEGYLDVIALAQHDFNNVVATLGTATSHYHIQALSKYTKQLIFCFDGDAAGRAAAWKALESCMPYLNQGLEAKFMFLSEEEDPDTLVHSRGRLGFEQYLQQALALHQLLINNLSGKYNIQTIAGKTQFITAIRPYLQKISPGPYQQFILNELSKRLLIDNDRILTGVHEKNTLITSNDHQVIRRSPIRLALALLIQSPFLLQECKSWLDINLFVDRNLAVLRKVIHQIQTRPAINTALLLELWRDTPYFDKFNQLAGWQHQVPSQAITKEFTDILLFLQKKNSANAINSLIEKSRQQTLTVTEKLSLQQLLKEKHL